MPAILAAAFRGREKRVVLAVIQDWTAVGSVMSRGVARMRSVLLILKQISAE